MNLKFIIPAALAAAASLAAPARISMPHIFSDNMVLQADTLAMLRGKASPGSIIKASGSWGATAQTKALRDSTWSMTIATPKASFDPLSLTVSDSHDGPKLTFNNILAGEVWFASGQSNMEMPLRGFWNQPVTGADEQITFSRKLGNGIRFVNVPKSASYTPQDDIDVRWVESNPENAPEFSAVAWYFATALRDMIDVPVGIINCAYGGSKVEGWEPAEIIARYPDRDMKSEQKDTRMDDWKRVGVMYNAMLLPFAGYTLRGFLWNQGESNVGGHSYYGARQAEMLDHWRHLWGNNDIPFYFVELPGWDYGDVNGTEAALFREAQQRAARDTRNAYIVCTSDLVFPDEPDDIHARNKRPIGLRLARAAATHTYGLKGLPHTYPTYKSMDNHGSVATLHFNDAWNGFTPNDSLEGFEVAGADRVFHPAKATIDRDKLTINVSSPEVNDIKSVRYCFRNFAIGKVHDLMGMPLVPFRTDTWDDTPADSTGFVSVRGGEFMLRGKPYRYVGANLWYAPILASRGTGGDRRRLAAELDSLQALGIDNLRILVGGDGDRSIESHIEPTLQTAPCVYNPDLLEGLDYLLADLEKRDMRAVLYLNNAWEWSGGYGSYLEWAGHGAAPVPAQAGYDAYMKFVSRFVTDSVAKGLYADHVRNIVGRTNAITGRPYSQSPAIMSWQIANEPRCFDPANKDAFRRWLIDTGRLIKSIDPNHLVSTGSEGMHGTEEDLDLWAAIHNSDAIDYANIHIWPYNWGWVTPETLDTDLKKACDNTREYILSHRVRTGKPIVLEEFGFPRDNMGLAPGSPTKSRDDYYGYVFDLITTGEAPINGANFWGWGGNARPAHRTWKAGDDYTGDPAQEDQGLNSVFSADRSTLDLIRRVNRR